MVKTTLALTLALALVSSSAMADTANINDGNFSVANPMQQVNFKTIALSREVNITKADQVYNTILSRFGDIRTNNQEGVFYLDEQDDHLLNALDELNQVFNGQYGVAVLGENGLILLKDNSAFPMMSTMKFMLAYAVASKMATNGDHLLKKVKLKISDLKTNTHSPLYTMIKGVMDGKVDPHLSAGLKAKPGFIKRFEALKQVSTTIPQDASFEITLADLIFFTVRYSDNNTCDYLLTQYLSGPKELEQFLQAKGLTSIKVQVTEGQMTDEVEKSYLNSISVYDAAKSLAIFDQDDDINVEVRDLINSAIFYAPSGVNRIQAGVKAAASSFNPELTSKVFNKTGLGAMNAQGERIAVNDMAYVEFNNKPYVIAIFAQNLAGSKEGTIKQGEEGIAKASEIIFKYLSKRQ